MMREGLCLAGILILALFVGIPNSRAGPPASGDWYVFGNELYSNTTLFVNGSVFVTPNATLVLDNTTLRINSTFDGQQTLQVNASGTLVLRNTVVEALDARFPYRFLVYGTLTATNTTVRYLWGDPLQSICPGGVMVYGGSLIARGLRLEFLESNGIDARRARVDAQNVSVDNAPCYDVYLGQTIGARFANLTFTGGPQTGTGVFSTDSAWGNFTDLVSSGHWSSEVDLFRSPHFTFLRAQLASPVPYVGFDGIVMEESPWGNFTDVVSRAHGGTEVAVSASDHVTFLRAELGSMANPGSMLVSLTGSQAFSLLSSGLTQTDTEAFSLRNSTASLNDVVFTWTGGMGADFHSQVVMENVRFAGKLFPGSTCSILSSNSSWIGRNITDLGADLEISLLDNSYGHFDNMSFGGIPYVNNSTIELVDTLQSNPSMFIVGHGSRAVLVNYSYSVPREGEWATTYVDWGSLLDPNRFSLVAQKNWLSVRTIDPHGTPIRGVDALVTDDGAPVYASAGYGGTNPPTGADGRTGEFAAPYRAFHSDFGNPSKPFTNLTYNATAIQLRKAGYAFLPARSLLLDGGFEDGTRDGWTRLTFTPNLSHTLEGNASVVPGDLNGTGSDLVELDALRDFKTDLLYNRLESAYWRDYTVEADARLVAGYPASSLKLFFDLRSTDGLTDGYRLDMSASNDTVSLYRHDHATLTWGGNPPMLLAQVPYNVDFGVTYHVRVDAIGGRIRVSINGTTVFEVQDATYASGSVGIGAATGGPGAPGPFVRAWFDNIRVYGNDGHTFVGVNSPPAIASALMTPDPTDVGSSGSIRAVVTDEVGVKEVWASVTGPTGYSNATMRESQPGLWELGVPAIQEGAYAFEVWAADVAGLWSSRAGTFSVADLSPPAFTNVAVAPAASPPGPFGFTANVTDNVGVALVWANVTGPSAANLTLSPAGGAWQASAPFALLGAYAATFWASDAAGHWASVRASFTVGDFAPPVTTVAILGANYTSGTVTYLAPAALVALRATDDLSGVARTEYRLDGSGWTLYATPFSLAAGPHLVEYRSADAWDNIEATRSAVLFLDATPPSIALRVDGPSAGTVLGPTASVNLTVFDGESGIAALEWRQDGGSWSQYVGPIPAGPEGAHTLEFLAWDHVGNTAPGTFVYQVDATPPTVALRVLGPSVGSLLGTNASLVLAATDSGSGVASLETRLDGGSWLSYAGPLAPGPEGAHVLNYRATDVVGNLGTDSYPYRVDATGPSISLVVGAPNETTPASFVSPSTPFSLSAVDSAGVGAVSYRIDGEPWIAYDAPFLLPREGPHAIEYNAVDALGNPSAIAAFATTVDGSSPDVRVLVGGPNATVGSVTYVDGATSFEARASDAGVGIASVACKVGGVARLCSPPFDLSGIEGSVVVEVHAIDRLGNDAILETTVFVDPPPFASIEALSGVSFTPGQAAVFSGLGSHDSAGIAAYAWDFGDGSRGSGVVASHSFADPGEHVVTLTVTNLLGRTSTTSIRVAVTPAVIPSEVIPGWVFLGVAVLGAALVFFAALWWRGRPYRDSATIDEDGDEKQSAEERE